MIFTDTEQTEYNYITGLKASIPKELQDKLVIKVMPKTSTDDLVNKALDFMSIHPQYGEAWIVFDRDKVTDFDKIIGEARKNDINVGWSNPCIEIWFHPYFGSMPNITDSVSCYEKFGSLFEQKTKQKYSQSDKSIYNKLVKFGKEDRAISISQSKLTEHESNGKKIYSEQCPASTLHILVSEIKSKIPKS